MKKVLIILMGFFLQIISNSCAFTNKLEGRVTNQVNGSAIAGAAIQLLRDGRATEYRTATDYDGRFTILNLPRGTYDVVIFHPEYVKKRIKGVEVESNQITTFSRAELAIKLTPPLIVKGKASTQVDEINYTKPSKVCTPPRPGTGKSDRENSNTTSAEPRGQIKGQVFDKKTKKPILHARVRLLLPDGTSAKRGNVTDDFGNFVIINVPPAVYDIEVSYGPTYTGHLIKNCKVEANRTYETGVILLSEKPLEPDTVFNVGCSKKGVILIR